MKNLIFSRDELSQLEALEIKGGASGSSDGIMSQTGCTNAIKHCGGTTPQTGCTNVAQGCGTKPPPRPQQACGVLA